MADDTGLTQDKQKEIQAQPLPSGTAPASGSSPAGPGGGKKTLSDRLPDLIPLSAAPDEPTINTGTEEGPRSFISRGEKIHKWGTYLGIDWVFNTLTGVSFAYWGSHTDMGRKLWSEPLTKGFTALLKPVIKNPEYLKASVAKGNIFMSIIAGGMFTIPPLMVLEKNENKLAITKWLDEKIYGKETVANDPRFQKAYDEILHEPKKGFTSGMISRGMALAPLLAMVLIPSTRKISNKAYFDHVEHASGAVANKFGFTAANSFKNVTPEVAKERWKFIHESIAMDFGLGIPYAMLHAFFYNMVASKRDKAEAGDKDAPAAAPAAEAPAAVSAPLADSWVEKTRGEKNAADLASRLGKHSHVEQIADKTPQEVLRV